MVHKIIKTENHLLVLGKNYKSDSFPYIVAEKLTTGDYQLWQVDNPNDIDEPNQFEILAHLPLNGSPILEGVDLLPPYHQEDYVDKLAKDFANNSATCDYEEGINVGKYQGYLEGYNKAREKYKYTEDDMKKAWIYGRANYDSDDNTFEQWIEKNEYPTEFETVDEYPVITDDDYFLKEEKSISKPKTITTAQGRQWVGKYL